MRRGIGAILLFGCGAAAAPRGVVLPPSQPPATVTPSVAPCSIRGGGELVELGRAAPFPLFATPRDAKPGLVIDKSRQVAVGWSELPSVAAPARAAIELGGQKMLRVHAYASLAGRGFQLRARGWAVRDHVWIDGGHVVELAGTDRGELVVRRPTGFSRPAFVEAHVACDVVAWERDAYLEPNAAEDEGALLEPSGGSITFYGSPTGVAFVEIVPGERGFAFRERERREGWVHVRAHDHGYGIDGWVREHDVKDGSGESIDLGNIGTIGRDGTAPKMMRVRRASPVLVGPTRAPFADAVFEEGALLDAWSGEDGFLRVMFEGRAIGAPEGMWIAEADVEAR